MNNFGLFQSPVPQQYTPQPYQPTAMVNQPAAVPQTTSPQLQPSGIPSYTGEPVVDQYIHKFIGNQ